MGFSGQDWWSGLPFPSPGDLPNPGVEPGSHTLQADAKAECERTDAFELWCWRRLLRVPWTARRSNQSILKEISPECSLEGLMLKLKLQYLATWCEELTHLKRSWCWERLKAGGEGGNRGWDSWMASPTWWTWVWASSGSWGWDSEAWRAAVHEVTKSRTRLSDWTVSSLPFSSNTSHKKIFRKKI